MIKDCSNIRQTPKKVKQQCKKSVSASYKKQDSQAQNQLIPFFDIVTNVSLATPLKKQPQFLSSPSPVRKDLFHQLLGTQTKLSSPYNTNINPSIMEEVDDEMFESSFIDQQLQSSNSGLQEDSNEGDNCQDSDNAIKKRKRKSTNQIKMLKAQLNGQMNWSKQKIIKMAEITGLSQSQVYKWCWDQKKKQNNHRHRHQNKYSESNKRKLIHKFFQHRQHLKDQQKLSQNQNEQNFEMKHQTKMKLISTFADSQNNTTQKKINKKLLFY